MKMMVKDLSTASCDRETTPTRTRRGAVPLRALLTLLAVLLGGCVMQGTYDELEQKCDEANARNTSRIQDLETALSSEQQKSASLTAQVEDLEGRLAKVVADHSSATAELEEMQLALRELNERRAEAEARIAEYRNLLERFKTLIAEGKLRVKIVDGRMVVELATDILFDSGKAQLSDEGEVAIQEVNAILASIPDRQYQIEGHTDNVPISNARFPSNWELSSARAISVVKTMIEAGMPAPRISASGYADTRPVASNETPEGRAANRRIEIVIVPDLTQLPGFEELQNMSSGDRS